MLPVFYSFKPFDTQHALLLPAALLLYFRFCTIHAFFQQYQAQQNVLAPYLTCFRTLRSAPPLRYVWPPPDAPPCHNLLLLLLFRLPSFPPRRCAAGSLLWGRPRPRPGYYGSMACRLMRPHGPHPRGPPRPLSSAVSLFLSLSPRYITRYS